MSAFYDELSEVSTSLINDFGAPATWIQTIAGTYDPQTGTSTDTTTSTQLNAVRVNYANRDIDGTLIKTTDFMLLVDGEHDISTDDKMTFDGQTLEIVNRIPVSPAAQRVLTKLQCRV